MDLEAQEKEMLNISIFGKALSLPQLIFPEDE
jgi:hypothetical protein